MVGPNKTRCKQLVNHGGGGGLSSQGGGGHDDNIITPTQPGAAAAGPSGPASKRTSGRTSSRISTRPSTGTSDKKSNMTSGKVSTRASSRMSTRTFGRTSSRASSEMSTGPSTRASTRTSGTTSTRTSNRIATGKTATAVGVASSSSTSPSSAASTSRALCSASGRGGGEALPVEEEGEDEPSSPTGQRRELRRGQPRGQPRGQRQAQRQQRQGEASRTRGDEGGGVEERAKRTPVSSERIPTRCWQCVGCGLVQQVAVPSATIEDLPDEMLQLVFSFVEDGPVLLDVVPLVCRRWLRLSRHAAAWARVDLTVGLASVADEGGGEAPDDDPGAARVLMHAPALRSLRLVESFFSGEKDARFLRTALAQTKASVREKVLVDDETWVQLAEDGCASLLALLTRSARHLRRLELYQLNSQDEDIAIAADADGRNALHVLASLQSLEELELSFLAPSEAYAGELDNVTFPKLRYLCISDLDWGGGSSKDLHAALVQAAAPTVRSLELNFEPTDWPGLEVALQSCQRLRRLVSLYSGLLFPAVTACTELEELEVRFWLENADDVGEIFPHCLAMKKLRSLTVTANSDLGNDEDWDSAMQHIAEFKEHRPDVHVLFRYSL